MLRPIGKLVSANSEGFLPRIGQPPRGTIHDLTRQIVEDARQVFGSNLISILLRGSAARGETLQTVADLDLLFVLHEDVGSGAHEMFQFSAPMELDIGFSTLETLHKLDAQSWLAFTLAHSGVTLWGRDVVSELPDPRLGAHSLAHLPRYDRWIKTFHDQKNNPQVAPHLQRWLCKRLVRSLFEARIHPAQIYSRDIYPCARVAAKHYHQYSNEIWSAAELAVGAVRPMHYTEGILERIMPALQVAKAELADQTWKL